MVKVNSIAKRAGVEIFIHSGIMLFSEHNAMSVLDEICKCGARILGIDGYYFNNGILVPDMNAIADFSSISDHRQSVNDARIFLEKRANRDYLFEFTLD